MTKFIDIMHFWKRFAGTVLLFVVAAALLPPPARGTTPSPRISPGTEDAVLPPGYVIEPVLTGLTYASSLCLGEDGALYVAEAGYCYGQFWTEPPRIFRFQPETGRVSTVAAGFRAPIMGLTFREGRLYVAHRGMVSTLETGGAGPTSRRVRDIVTDLPVAPNGQHFNSPVAFGPDGKMYFAVGAFTNSGVPGADDALYGWLLDLPDVRDAPAREITLSGGTYPSPDVLGPTTRLLNIVQGSAFLPFGVRARPGQTIPAHPRPTSAIFRANPDGSGQEVVAWGLRSPVGFAFGPDGRLYFTEHAMDDKGARAVGQANDALWVFREGAWYGWPDFAAGLPVTDERFRPRFPITAPPRFVLQNPPPVEQPLARFEPHVAAMSFDWSRSERFGFAGALFLAEFGDGQPVTTGLRPIPRKGFRVVRVNTETGDVEPFLTIDNPGTERTRGPKRPFAVLFDRSGENLYLLDYGVLAIRVTPQRVGIDAPIQTGTLWRIRRQGPAEEARPPVARVRGGRHVSWWSARGPILIIQKDLRAAARHSEIARSLGPFDQRRLHHREQAEALLGSAGALATFTLQRLDDPRTVEDDGTRLLLLGVRDLADTVHPLTLRRDDPCFPPWTPGRSAPAFRMRTTCRPTTPHRAADRRRVRCGPPIR